MNKKTLITFLLPLAVSCSSSDDKTIKTQSKSTTNENIQSFNWIGKWERHERNNEATLTINKIENGEIYFSITAFHGANIGDVEGRAKVDKNKSIYFLHYNSPCNLEFTLRSNDTIEVEQITSSCDAGIGVYFSGLYINSKLGLKEKEEDFVSLGIFKTKQQQLLFKKLVSDKYDVFLNSALTTTEVEDLDSLNAKCFSSGVSGLYTIMENIIMYNSKNEIWCAAIDDEKVYYYTNSHRYKNELPKTIEKWREEFREKEVIMTSQNK